jgi:hypothetical protein
VDALFQILKIRLIQDPIPFMIPGPSSAISSNLHRANIHYSIHIAKTYRRTRTGQIIKHIWMDTRSSIDHKSGSLSQCSVSQRTDLSIYALPIHKLSHFHFLGNQNP